MRKAILLAILPLALAAKREQTSCNESCTKVLQKQQESCPSGSDSSCLCELSDSDYWEPLADCDCINPDKKFSLKEIKSQICGAPEEPSSSKKQSTSSSSKSSSSSSSSLSTSTEASSSDDITPITESAVAAAALQETTTETAAPVAETTTVPGEAVTETVAGEVETATEVAPAVDANTDTVAASFTELQPVPAQSAPPVILAQPAVGNQTDLSQVTVQAFENGAAARVGVAAGSLFALALNFL